MAMQKLFDAATKAEVERAVAAVERSTSAEIVVAVAPESGFYRHADLIAGMIAATLTLAVFLYYPEPFDWTYLPLELAAVFVLGAVLCRNVEPLRRSLVGARLLSANVRRAARERFVDLGVSKTKDRTGVLVFVSAFERRVEVVADVGVDPAVMGVGFSDAVKKLDRALRLDADIERFVEALGDLGEALGAALPRAADDVNELPDGVDDPASDDDDDEEPASDRSGGEA